jgi:hypothetical protein
MNGGKESSSETDNRFARYTPPKVIRYNMLNQGLGDCQVGSGDSRTCEPGNTAGSFTGGACESGSVAGIKCEPGSAAFGKCEAGSGATGVCYSGSGGTPG